MIEQLNFNKNNNGLIPVIIQDYKTATVLMLGYMNKEAFKKTRLTQKVCFYSRTKKRLWTKGESSGNFLNVIKIMTDCDFDSLLIKVKPEGPVCHKGSDSCWGESNSNALSFLSELEDKIAERRQTNLNTSYVSSLFEKGINKIAQKVGEEAIEMVIEAKDDNKDLFLNESADLLFHYLILLQAKGFGLKDVTAILEQRAK
ncbi:MAG: bifunctional phosphoribosyl-AMP cyclohydrolase/phosphoribosyl-ATP diphosphatase [Bacteroidetes bacterium MedPE-SWsnd-G2]|nr:MAG: bifunctional phosphoribosyl-AMP cyclohydrolase/phosphoribosyl-ATP diphosphatase [Bacteroidetes bacterium MedPE-SWsnd-G2]